MWSLSVLLSRTCLNTIASRQCSVDIYVLSMYWKVYFRLSKCIFVSLFEISLVSSRVLFVSFPCEYLFLFRFINYRFALRIIRVQILWISHAFSLVTLNQYSTPNLIRANVNKTILKCFFSNDRIQLVIRKSNLTKLVIRSRKHRISVWTIKERTLQFDANFGKWMSDTERATF